MLCVCLCGKNPYPVYIVDSLRLMVPQLTPEQSLYNECILFTHITSTSYTKAHHAFRKTSVPCSGVTVNFFFKKRHKTKQMLSVWQKTRKEGRPSASSTRAGKMKARQLKQLVLTFCTCLWMTTSASGSFLVIHWNHKYESVNSNDLLLFSFHRSEAQRIFVMLVLSSNLKLGFSVSNDPCSFSITNPFIESVCVPVTPWNKSGMNSPALRRMMRLKLVSAYKLPSIIQI